MSTLLAIDDGLVNGNLNAADLLFLVAAVLFGVVAFMQIATKATESALVALGFCLVSIGLLVL